MFIFKEVDTRSFIWKDNVNAQDIATVC